MEKLQLITKLLTSEEKATLQRYVENPFEKFRHDTFKGRDLIPNSSEVLVEFMDQKWDFKEGDVIIASYPKTGTTWTYEIVRLMLYNNNQTFLDLTESFPLSLRYLERGQAIEKFSILDKLPLNRRIFVTHLTPNLINMEKIKKSKAKVIYVYRNPKDQIVSWLKFLQQIPLGKFEDYHCLLNKGWDAYVNHVLAGNFYVNMKPGEWYPDHILSWYPHRDNENVYFVAYEDLKKGLFNEVKKLSQFLQVSLNNEEALKIANACGFKNMKERFGSDAMSEKLMQKGQVGGWKNYFTVSQSERVDTILEEKMKDTDIKFTYTL